MPTPPPAATWADRLQFFRKHIIGDVISPLAGLAVFAYLVVNQSALIPAYVFCAGLVGVPGLTRIADMIGGPK